MQAAWMLNHVEPLGVTKMLIPNIFQDFSSKQQVTANSSVACRTVGIPRLELHLPVLPGVLEHFYASYSPDVWGVLLDGKLLKRSFFWEA